MSRTGPTAAQRRLREHQSERQPAHGHLHGGLEDERAPASATPTGSTPPSTSAGTGEGDPATCSGTEVTALLQHAEELPERARTVAQTMRRAEGYLGYRVGIAEDGRWMFATAGD